MKRGPKMLKSRRNVIINFTKLSENVIDNAEYDGNKID